MDKKIKISNIFEWLNEITVNKSPLDIISDESWDTWNSYMIHRYVSMDINYIDIVNYVQKINPQNKRQIYQIYKEMIPKRKTWFKYVKSEIKKDYKELAEYVAKYFDCSLGEAEHYIDILREFGVKEILNEMGVNEKDANKLIKKAKI
jgi:hypothetical protein